MIGCGQRGAELLCDVNNTAMVATEYEAMREVGTCVREVVMAILTVDSVFQ
jgi:hypothetical protein